MVSQYARSVHPPPTHTHTHTHSQFRLFCRHPKSGDLYEKRLEVQQDVPMVSVTEQSHKVHSC